MRGELERHDDISALRSAITEAEPAVHAGMGTEIRRVDLIATIEAALPDEGTITSFSASGTTSMDSNGYTAASPLASEGVGTIDLPVELPSLPDTADWLDALNGIPGFMDAAFGSATLSTDDTTGAGSVQAPFPHDVALPEFVRWMDGPATASGATVQSVTVGSPSEVTESAGMVPVSLTVLGNFTESADTTPSQTSTTE